MKGGVVMAEAMKVKSEVAERERKNRRCFSVLPPTYVMNEMGRGRNPRGRALEPKRRDPVHYHGATWKA